jgi:hypothetical protein
MKKILFVTLIVFAFTAITASWASLSAAILPDEIIVALAQPVKPTPPPIPPSGNPNNNGNHYGQLKSKHK